MTPEQGGLAALVAFVTGIFTWLSARAKARADGRTAQAVVADGTWARVQDSLKRLDKEVEELQAENLRISARHEELWEENRRLREENKDQQNLIEEMASGIIEWEEWIHEGADPPPPSFPDRLKKYLARVKNHHH